MGDSARVLVGVLLTVVVQNARGAEAPPPRAVKPPTLSVEADATRARLLRHLRRTAAR